MIKRSLWKGTFVKKSILNRLEWILLHNNGNKRIKPLKLYQKNSCIRKIFNKLTFYIHNGKLLRKKYLKNENGSNKFGMYCYTRKI